MADEDGLKILKQRYAKGEIKRKEYLEMKKDLEEEVEEKDDEDREEIKKIVKERREGRINKEQKGHGLWKGLLLTFLIMAIVFGYWYWSTYLNYYTPSCYYTNSCTAAFTCPTGFELNLTGNGCMVNFGFVAGLFTGSSHLNLTQADVTLLENCYNNYTAGQSLSSGCTPKPSCPTDYSLCAAGCSTTSYCVINNMCGTSGGTWNINPPKCYYGS